MKTTKSYTLLEIADFYNVTQKTLYTWLNPIREKLLEMNPARKKRLRVLIPKQVEFIKEFLG